MGHHGLLLLSFILLLLGVAGMTAEEGWAHAKKVLREHIKAPTFPDSDRSIADFGAVGDGKTDCTEAFRNAIAVCSSSGGGRVVVPPNGVYLTGPIVLKSNVNLHIPETATIRFKQDPKFYLPLVRSRMGRCGAHELFAAHLCLRRGEHRHHRWRNVGRECQRHCVVALEAGSPRCWSGSVVPNGGRQCACEKEIIWRGILLTAKLHRAVQMSECVDRGGEDNQFANVGHSSYILFQCYCEVGDCR